MSSALPADIATYRLVTLPLAAEVVPAETLVYWRVPADGLGVHPKRAEPPVYRLDPHTRRAHEDPWLTGLFAQRRVEEWVVRGRTVAWIETRPRPLGGTGGRLVSTSVCMASRDDGSAVRLTPVEWGFVSDTGAKSPAMSGLVFDGELAAWHDVRSSRTNGGVPQRGADAGIFAVRVGDSAPRFVGRSVAADRGPLAVAGSRVFYTSDRASADPGSQALQWWDASCDHQSGSRVVGSVDDLAVGGTTVVWESPPADSDGASGGSLSAIDLSTGKIREIAASGAGQAEPAVCGDFVVWVACEPPTPGDTATSETDGWSLQGCDLRTNCRFSLSRPSHSLPPDRVVAAGENVYWTVKDTKTVVYGAHPERGATAAIVQPIGVRP
jgi:hypothetical protein